MTPDTTDVAEHQVREGAPPNDGPVGGLPGPSAEIDRDAPSGLPDADAPEATPLGTPEQHPDGEGDAPRGPEHMPGIPTGGEPPTSG
jgi:hypothetical protein